MFVMILVLHELEKQKEQGLIALWSFCHLQRGLQQRINARSTD
jgi:hypothetical protein